MVSTRPFILAVLVAAAFVAPSHADDMLSGAEIKDMIGGRKIMLSTPYGLEMPLLYRVDGSVKGDISGFRLASLFAPRETGRWWVSGNRLCQKWPNWYDGKQFCFTLRATGGKSLAWTRDDGLSGTARIGG